MTLCRRVSFDWLPRVCVHLHFILFFCQRTQTLRHFEFRAISIVLIRHTHSAFPRNSSTLSHTLAAAYSILVRLSSKLIIRNCFYFHFIKLIDSYLTHRLLPLHRSLQRKFIQSKEKQQDVFVCFLLCVYSYSYCELCGEVSPSSRLHIARVSYVVCRQAATILKRTKRKKEREKPIQG